MPMVRNRSAYHDEEWGVPEWDSRALWEKLVLDGFQAGLAWITILRKRDGFRARFEDFDPGKVARWGEAEVAQALLDPGIVRHRGKIEATVQGARLWLEIEAEGGFDAFLWDFVGGEPIQNRFEAMADVPAETPLSREISKALKARGFKFVGPTIVYAFMQAVGMVNDHLIGCPCHEEVARLGKAGRPARRTSPV
ncbi:MAG: DNA-3-methyladenine glycosylase I [Pseudomonadota bacterium]